MLYLLTYPDFLVVATFNFLSFTSKARKTFLERLRKFWLPFFVTFLSYLTFCAHFKYAAFHETDFMLFPKVSFIVVNGDFFVILKKKKSVHKNENFNVFECILLVGLYVL